jgi:hypothetical protein
MSEGGKVFHGRRAKRGRQELTYRRRIRPLDEGNENSSEEDQPLLHRLAKPLVITGIHTKDARKVAATWAARENLGEFSVTSCPETS